MEKTASSNDSSGKVLKGESNSKESEQPTGKAADDQLQETPQEEVTEETQSEIRQRLWVSYGEKLNTLSQELASDAKLLQGGGAQRLNKISRDVKRLAEILK